MANNSEKVLFLYSCRSKDGTRIKKVPKTAGEMSNRFSVEDISSRSMDEVITLITEKDIHDLVIFCHATGMLDMFWGKRQDQPEVNNLVNMQSFIQKLESKVSGHWRILFLACHAGQLSTFQAHPSPTAGGQRLISLHHIKTAFNVKASDSQTIIEKINEEGVKKGFEYAMNVEGESGTKYLELARKKQEFEIKYPGKKPTKRDVEDFIEATKCTLSFKDLVEESLTDIELFEMEDDDVVLQTGSASSTPPANHCES